MPLQLPAVIFKLHTVLPVQEVAAALAAGTAQAVEAGCVGGEPPKPCMSVLVPLRPSVLPACHQCCLVPVLSRGRLLPLLRSHLRAPLILPLLQCSPPASCAADVVAVQWLLFEQGQTGVLRDTLAALTGWPAGAAAAGRLSWHAIETGRCIEMLLPGGVDVLAS